MADQQRVFTPTGSRSAVRRSYIRTSSQSPSRHQQRLGDDLLSQLSPNAAVDALRSPTGALKACMDKASASEQAFAMRTAIASKKIRDWLEELSSWTWQRGNGSTGFEMPPAKKRKLFEPETPPRVDKGKLPESNPPYDTDYLGSLRVTDVDRYEKRVEKIQRDLDELDLEEIKSQVLHNHILPLSRPSSPAFSDSGLSTISTSMFAKMEDLTAVVTAITMQALPNLSRLTRFLNTWTMRLLVLRKIPSLMTMMADAEVALRSGWNAIESPESSPTRATGRDDSSSLSRKEFDIIKRVIQQKVTKPGRALDYMLDSLEGSMDTLPDAWLDQMEQIERGYAIWEATAERKVLAGEGSSKDVSIRTEPETPRPKIHVEGPSPTVYSPVPSDFDQFASPTPDPKSAEDMENSPELPKERPAASSKPTAVKFLVNQPRKDIPGSTSQVIDLSTVAAQQREVDSGAKVEDPSLSYDGASKKRPVAVKKATPKSISVMPDFPRLSRPSKQSRGQTHDRPENRQASENPRTSPVLGEVDRNIIRSPPPELKKSEVTVEREPVFADELESSVLEPSVLEPVDEEGEGEELELPPARFVNHKTSNQSIASTVIHGTSNNFGNSDNALFREGSMEPDLPRLADPDEPFSSDNISPPSSPPLRYKTRSTSVTFKDVPEIASLPELGSSPPRSPLEAPSVFDADASFEDESQAGSPGRMSTISSISEDEHLHQQISDILESIPAKIRIKRTPAVNLNPPDLQLPSRPKSRASDFARRSNSSLSARSGTSFSRSGTPSFMLAPARDPRAKTKSSQGIRVYHLSRSTGEPPLKLLIRCVGEKGERVMVRIGGGWADLGEYLREYAVHHSSRSKGEGKVDIRDLPTVPSGLGSSPSSRPGSAMDSPNTPTPLLVRKTRKSLGEEGAPRPPKTPFSTEHGADSPSSQTSARSRSSSHVDWDEEDSSLGLAGPKGRKVDMSDESRAWVESVKEKVRIASGDRIPPPEQRLDTKFGEMGKVGGTKRLFKRN